MRPSLRTLRLALNRQAPRSLAEARNMSLTVGAGGYTIPVGFVRNLELALLAFGGVRQVAEILRTDGYAAMPWPTADDTGNKGALLAEATTIGSSVDPTISEVVFNAYKFSSKLVKVSAELLQDSAFNLADILGSMLGERIGRIENDYQTTGSGNDQPNGIVTAAATGVTTASATAIAADELIDLVHSVDPAYRPGAAFMMHDSVIKALRKLKDGEGRYLWVSGLATGMADSLLGYPIVPNQSMASSIAHLAKTVLFGQFSKYKIREVATIRLRRLVERYADTDEEGFVAFTRMDSDLLDAGTHPVKLLVQV
jgi:HK97 family phage major capsid protein